VGPAEFLELASDGTLPSVPRVQLFMFVEELPELILRHPRHLFVCEALGQLGQHEPASRTLLAVRPE